MGREEKASVLRRHCGLGGGWGHVVAQLAPVSVFFSVAVEHINATRDGYDCYGRSISPVARLQFI